MSFFSRALLLGAALLFSSSVAAQEITSVNASERGTAARYETGATGTPTASGEPYNPERLTLAHPTLPFGTLVQLTNLDNGQTVWARVNDRAPAAPDLRLQLSARAADHLGLPARGGDVVLTLGADEVALLEQRAAREKDRAKAAPAAPITSAPTGMRFTVQLASFSDEARALARADEIRGAWVLPVAVNGATVYRVCYGVFDTSARASAGQIALQARGIDGFVKSLDAPAARAEDTPVRPASTGN